MKVYMPQRYVPAASNWFGRSSPERRVDSFNPEIVRKYFDLVETPGEADFALMGIESPDGGTGYDVADLEKGGNGYVPITLQYGPYKAEFAP